jgi:hypothetical protein
VLTDYLSGAYLLNAVLPDDGEVMSTSTMQRDALALRVGFRSSLVSVSLYFGVGCVAISSTPNATAGDDDDRATAERAARRHADRGSLRVQMFDQRYRLRRSLCCSFLFRSISVNSQQHSVAQIDDVGRLCLHSVINRSDLLRHTLVALCELLDALDVNMTFNSTFCLFCLFVV